eukprot:1674694-Amphidinium_carterae.1
MSNAHSAVQIQPQPSPTQVHDIAISNRVVELRMASVCSAWAKPPITQCSHCLACKDLLRLALWFRFAALEGGQVLAAVWERVGGRSKSLWEAPFAYDTKHHSLSADISVSIKC